MHRVQVACGCNKNAACPTPTRRLPHTPQQPILYKPKSPQPRNGANPPRLTAQRGSTRLKAHAPGTLRTSRQRDIARQSVKNKRSTTPYSICNLDGADFARAWATVCTHAATAPDKAKSKQQTHHAHIGINSGGADFARAWVTVHTERQPGKAKANKRSTSHLNLQLSRYCHFACAWFTEHTRQRQQAKREQT